jgi:hypothetical protein
MGGPSVGGSGAAAHSHQTLYSTKRTSQRSASEPTAWRCRHCARVHAHNSQRVRRRRRAHGSHGQRLWASSGSWPHRPHRAGCDSNGAAVRTSSSFCWSIACISSVSWCVPGGFCASTAASRAAASAGMSIEFRRRNVSVLIGAPHGSAPGRSPAFCRARAAAGSEVCGMSQSAALAGHRFDILSASGSSAGRCSGTHRADPVHCRATACGGGGYWCCNTPDQAASPWRPAIIPAAVQQRRRSGCPASQCRGTVRCGRAQVAQHRKSSS